MITLQLLGGLSVDRPGLSATSATRRKRSLAFLALAATAAPQAIAREKLLGYLWPESDSERARNSLRQMLFALRKELGEDLFLPETSGSLQLDPANLTVDLWEFRSALARGAAAEAVAFYKGPFLDGFYINGLSEFAQRIENERQSLERQYLDALDTLARQAEQAGRFNDAVEWRRRQAATDPLSARIALALLKTLSGAGDRAGALEFARVYEELVRQELEAEPDASVTDFVASLRRKTTPLEVTRQSGSRRRTPTNVARQTPRVVPVVARRSTPVEIARVALQRSSSWARRHPLLFAGSLMLGVLVVTAASFALDRASPALAASLDETSLVVLPFDGTESRDAAALGSALADLVAAGLDGTDGLRTVRSVELARAVSQSGVAARELHRVAGVGRKAGVGLIVTGSVVSQGGTVQATASLIDPARGTFGRPVHASGSASDLEAVSQTLARRLLGDLYSGQRNRFKALGASGTESLAAAKAFLEGERRLEADDYAGAVEALSRATQLDSGYAIAFHRLSEAAGLAGRSGIGKRAAERAVALSAALPDRERRLTSAAAARRLGDLDVAERRYREFLIDYPDDAPAWTQLGDLLFHGNPQRGRSRREAREALERALMLDPDNRDVLLQLARLAVLDGPPEDVRKYVLRARQGLTNPVFLDMRSFRAYALGDRPGQNTVTRAMLAERGLLSPSAILNVVISDDVAGVERFGQHLVSRSTSADIRSLGWRLQAHALVAQGRIVAAREAFRAAEPFDRFSTLAQWALVYTQPFVPASAAELVFLRDELEALVLDPDQSAASGGMHEHIRLHRLGMLALRLGDTAGTLRFAARLDRITATAEGAQVASTLAMTLRARVAAAGRRDAKALELLEAANWPAAAGVLQAEVAARFFRAELLERLGRRREAAQWLESIGTGAAYELPYLAPAHFARARIAADLGDPDEAIRLYRKFIEMWMNADNALQPVVGEARQKLKEFGG